LKLITYDGAGNGYLLILTNKKRPGGTLREAGEVPVAALYVLKNQVIAVSDQDYDILNEQGHIGDDKLHDWKPPYGPGDKPVPPRVIDPQ
jgi:hypothetical protein